MKRQQSAEVHNIAPYTFSAMVHRGQDLAVADFSSSDPYILFALNGAVVARTPTIYKSLNPVWEFPFPDVKMYSIVDSKIIFQLFSEDRRRNDVLLGEININLSTLILNKPTKIFIELEQANDKFVAKGGIQFTLLLSSNNDIIRIIRTVQKTSQLESNDQSQSRDKCQALLIKRQFEPSGPILKFLRDSTVGKYASIYDESNGGLLDDILGDAQAIIGLKRSLSYASENYTIHFVLGTIFRIG